MNFHQLEPAFMTQTQRVYSTRQLLHRSQLSKPAILPGPGLHWVGLRLHSSLQCNINRLVLASVIN